ncbi:MAG: hypothetical protein GKS06_02420 [Acidobacteria bacterium]|nr:hypothetical protein [Acidobacteriota bacterium]
MAMREEPAADLPQVLVAHTKELDTWVGSLRGVDASDLRLISGSLPHITGWAPEQFRALIIVASSRRFIRSSTFIELLRAFENMPVGFVMTEPAMSLADTYASVMFQVAEHSLPPRELRARKASTSEDFEPIALDLARELISLGRPDTPPVQTKSQTVDQSDDLVLVEMPGPRLGWWVPEELLGSPEGVDYETDVPSKLDHLGRDAVALSVAQLLNDVHGKLEGAFLVQLHGRWGSGKSTLLELIRPRLTTEPPSRRWIVVDFNAWREHDAPSAWWALVEAVYRQSRQQLDNSIDFFRGTRLGVWRRVWRARNLWSGQLVATVIVTVLFWLAAGRVEQAWIADSMKGATAVVASFGGAMAIVRSLRPSGARADALLRDSMTDPRGTLRSYFSELVRRIGQPMVIFIDDLDRCGSSFVVGFLQSILTTLRDAPVVYVVAADGDWLRNSYEQEYATYKGVGDTGPHATLGDRFMEKVFQVSISLPRVPDETRSEFWAHLLGADAGREEPSDEELEAARGAFEDAPSEQAVLDDIAEADEDGGSQARAARRAGFERLAARDLVASTEHFLLQFADLVGRNPRQMKRLLNAYRLNRGVRILLGYDINRAHLALWSVLQMRWPRLAEYLRENPDAILTDHDHPEGAPVAVLETQEVQEVIDRFGVNSRDLAEAIRRCT